VLALCAYIGAIDEVRRFFDLNTISTTRRRLRLAGCNIVSRFMLDTRHVGLEQNRA
jgi:hypothetical protein